MNEYTIIIDESERQVILLALAQLAVDRPGWEPACIVPIAQKMDDHQLSMFRSFKSTTVPAHLRTNYIGPDPKGTWHD